MKRDRRDAQIRRLQNAIAEMAKEIEMRDVIIDEERKKVIDEANAWALRVMLAADALRKCGV